jgi:hypothetical protein
MACWRPAGDTVWPTADSHGWQGLVKGQGHRGAGGQQRGNAVTRRLPALHQHPHGHQHHQEWINEHRSGARRCRPSVADRSWRCPPPGARFPFRMGSGLYLGQPLTVLIWLSCGAKAGQAAARLARYAQCRRRRLALRRWRDRPLSRPCQADGMFEDLACPHRGGQAGRSGAFGPCIRGAAASRRGCWPAIGRVRWWSIGVGRRGVGRGGRP